MQLIDAARRPDTVDEPGPGQAPQIERRRPKTSADSGDGPVVFILLIVGMIVIFSMLIFEFTVHPPIWVHLILWLPLATILTLAALRPFKGVMIAMQFHNKASEHRSDE